MLTKLSIENIALVRKLELSFKPGMSALTGETGAGKSVVVTAIGLALGGRADREFIRHGAEAGKVIATFDLSEASRRFRREFSEFIDGDSLTLHREIRRDGGTRSYLNGKRIGQARLKPLAMALGEILGQHANQSLMNEENHLGFLDQFAGLEDIVDQTRHAFAAWRSSAEELSRLKRNREQLIQQRELLLFQKNEIEKASISVGEEESLLREKKILDSARSLMNSASMIENIMDGEQVSIKAQIAALRSELEKMASIDPTLEKQASELFDIDMRLEDLRRTIEQYGSSLTDDPSRLEEINSRLDELYHLKKKYGGSEEAVLATLNEINEQLDERPNTDRLISRLESETEELRKAYSKLAVDLSDRRRKASKELQRKVVAELNDLAIPDARFEVEFIVEDDPDGIVYADRCVKSGEYGLEQARFMFSANPAEPVRPLVKTASGGEVSRVLLALKAAGQSRDDSGASLIVFDEVDAGIGGRTADEVGRKLKLLARNRQLIVVTHLHQIARRADCHFVVEKSLSDDRNVIEVRALDEQDRIAELDRMVALPSDD